MKSLRRVRGHVTGGLVGLLAVYGGQIAVAHGGPGPGPSPGPSPVPAGPSPITTGKPPPPVPPTPTPSNPIGPQSSNLPSVVTSVVEIPARLPSRSKVPQKPTPITHRSFPKPPSMTPPGVLHAPSKSAPGSSTAFTPGSAIASTPFVRSPGGLNLHPPKGVPGAVYMDFEPSDASDPSGHLTGWTRRNGGAVQVSCGRMDPRGLPNGNLIDSQIGGDYWNASYWPGQSRDCYLDSGAVSGTWVSPDFVLGSGQTHISFLVSGGGGGGSIRLEVDGLSSASVRQCDQSTIPPTCTYVSENLPGVALVERGPGVPGFVRVDWDLTPIVRANGGRHARIVVVGNGGRGIQLDQVISDTVAAAPTRAPLWGLADLHAHVFNNLGFGGRLMAGQPSGPMSTALNECQDEHGKDLAAGASPALLAPEDADHNRWGYPTFDGWPKAHKTIVHQQAYIDWIKRAWAGGLRLLEIDAGNSEFSAHAWAVNAIHLMSDPNPNPMDDRRVVDLEVQAAKDFLAGPGSGWAELALGPADVRRIVSQGKLAVVLGLEVEALGNFIGGWCAPGNAVPQLSMYSLLGTPTCDILPNGEGPMRAALRAYVQHLYDEGVRHVFPVHLTENLFGYPATYNRLLDTASQWQTGNSYKLVNGFSKGVRYGLDRDDSQDSFDHWLLDILSATNAGFDTSRLVDGPGGGQVAQGGLKPAGRVLMQELMRHGMLIDMDHMGENTAEDALHLSESTIQYPLMLSHTGFRDLGFGATVSTPWVDREHSMAQYGIANEERLASDRLVSADHLDRLRRLGGVVGIGLGSGGVGGTYGSIPNDCDGTSKSWVQGLLYAIDHTGGRGLAVGSDINGWGLLPSARFGTGACPDAHDDDYRKPLVRQLAFAQSNGVRYTTGLRDAGAARFQENNDDWAYSGDERRVWEALAEADACASVDCIRTYKQRPPGPRLDEGWIKAYALGFWAAAHGGSGPPDNDDNERRAYNAAKGRSDPNQPYVKVVYDQWQKMSGGNRPMIRYVVSGYDSLNSENVTRDFDVNLEGMAHYGLLPDYLQDVKNVGVSEQQMASLFMAAEDFVEMWELTTAKAGDAARMWP